MGDTTTSASFYTGSFLFRSRVCTTEVGCNEIHSEHSGFNDPAPILGLSVGVPPLPEAAVLRHAPGEADEVVGALEEAVLGAAAVHRVLEAAVLGGAPEDGLLDLVPLSAVEEVVVDVVLALVAVALLVDRVLDVGPEGG